MKFLREWQFRQNWIWNKLKFKMIPVLVVCLFLSFCISGMIINGVALFTKSYAWPFSTLGLIIQMIFVAMFYFVLTYRAYDIILGHMGEGYDNMEVINLDVEHTHPNISSGDNKR